MDYCKYCMAEMEGGGRFCTSCGRDQSEAEPAHHLKSGTSLVGRYIIGTALGEGGFGITYIGRDVLYDTKVAIKEYYPAGYANRDTLASTISYGSTADRVEYFKSGKARFLREAKTLARFAGEPGIVAVQNFFEANNTAYLVMELLEGLTLKAYLKKNGRMTPEKTLEFLLPVMESLKKVHAVGLIHRDISPDNIMITKQGVKLLDFGAARTVSAQANKSLSIMLKPGYAPEEQYRSRGEQGPWTDVYALCATIYKCITGKTPVDSTQRVFEDELKPPSELGIEVSPHFEAALMKGLGVFSRNRIKDMDELIAAFSSVPEEPQDEMVFIPEPEVPESFEAPESSEGPESIEGPVEPDGTKELEDPGEPGGTMLLSESPLPDYPEGPEYPNGPEYPEGTQYLEEEEASEDDSEDDSDNVTSMALMIFGIIAAIGAVILILSLIL